MNIKARILSLSLIQTWTTKMRVATAALPSRRNVNIVVQYHVVDMLYGERLTLVENHDSSLIVRSIVFLEGLRPFHRIIHMSCRMNGTSKNVELQALTIHNKITQAQQKLMRVRWHVTLFEKVKVAIIYRNASICACVYYDCQVDLSIYAPLSRKTVKRTLHCPGRQNLKSTF